MKLPTEGRADGRTEHIESITTAAAAAAKKAVME